MGAKHSKPRIRRNRRFSSLRKRQAPEGSNDPEPIPNETWNRGSNKENSFDVKPGVNESCKYCGSPEKCLNFSRDKPTKICDDVIKRGMHASDSKSFFEDFMHRTDLKVNLPRSPACCRNYVTTEKSKSLPSKAAFHDPNNKLTDEKNDDKEWAITLYEIDKLSGRVPREDMVRLMSSIYEAVDAKVGESPQGRKTVRVRLSVTPERRSHAKVHRTSSTPQREQSQCRCANCPDTEPPSRKMSTDPRLRRNKSDVSPVRHPVGQNLGGVTHVTRPTQTSVHRRPSHEHSGENVERARHYAKLEGLDHTMHLHKKDHHGCVNAKSNEKSRTLPQNRHRTLPNFDDLPKATGTTKHRQRYITSDHRTAMLRTRRKDPRFASPYDQHFQEAMYLRLRELQRQGTFEMRRATGRLRDSDDADDDSGSEAEAEKSKCNSAERTAKPGDDSLVLNTDISDKVVSKASSFVTPNESLVDQTVSSVHHHHHYHHGLSDASVSSVLNSPDALAVKCITNATNISCSSVVPKTDDKSTEHHHHHYHHHYHHAEDS